MVSQGTPCDQSFWCPFSDEEVNSNDEIIREIEDYVMDAEKEDRVQAGDSLYISSHQTSGG